jgi:hypothetical protein
MIDEYGKEKMAELLTTLGTGLGIDAALDVVYGFGIDGLENLWRESIGAEPYIEPTPGPTPTPNAEPTPTYKLLTSPPSSSSPDDDSDSESNDEVEPTVAPEVVAPEIEVDEPSESGEVESEEPVLIAEEQASGGFCSSPSEGSIDGTSGAWLLVIVGLAAGGRYRAQHKS